MSSGVKSFRALNAEFRSLDSIPEQWEEGIGGAGVGLSRVGLWSNLTLPEDPSFSGVKSGQESWERRSKDPS